MAQQATVFVQFETQNKTNPVAMAIGQIVKVAGGVIVDKLIDDQEVEVDIAMVNSVEAALRLIKETEKTLVFLTYFGKRQEHEVVAFAARFPERVKAAPLIEGEGEENLLVRFMKTIAEMGKEGK